MSMYCSLLEEGRAESSDDGRLLDFGS